MEKISPPVRILSIVLVLVGVAGMLMLRTMGPSEEIVAVPLPAQKPAVKVAQASVAATPQAGTAKAAPAKAKTQAKAQAKAQASAPAPKPVNPVVPPTGFPLEVDEALRAHEVVVVSLVVPGARVDELAAAEAQAGATLGGAGYLALNVLNEKVARALLTKLETVEDPSVLVITRPGEVALKLAGFVDRETVAQAAANAAS